MPAVFPGAAQAALPGVQALTAAQPVLPGAQAQGITRGILYKIIGFYGIFNKIGRILN